MPLTTEDAVRAVLMPHSANSPIEHLQETLSVFRRQQGKERVVVSGGIASGKNSARMEHLKEVSPDAYELAQQLPLEYQKTITLFFPIHGEEPFVGVEINGKGMQPGDPTSYTICNQLLAMLWEENPAYLQWGMEQAKRQRYRYPAYMPDHNAEDLLDVESTVVEAERNPNAISIL